MNRKFELLDADMSQAESIFPSILIYLGLIHSN